MKLNKNESGSITGRRKAEQTVEEAREYAESIVDTVRESLIVLDADLKVVSANKSFYRDFKVSPKETKGRLIYDLGNRQWNIPALRKLLEDILPKKSVFNDYEIEHDFEDIGPKTMLLNARRLDNVQKILLAIEDVTERKNADMKKIKLFSDAIASAFDCFFLTDMKGNITYANASACMTFGYTHEEFLKLNITDLDASEKDAKRIMQEIQMKGKWNGEVINIKKNKENFTSLLSAFIIKDEKDRPKGAMGILRDITKRKKAENELKKSKEVLQSKVDELERIIGLTVGRELKMVELKKTIKDMENK